VDEVYLSGRVDTKIPRRVEWIHGVATARGHQNPYPTLAATARVFGISAKRVRELRAMVTEALARHDKRSTRKRIVMGRRTRAARRS